MAGAYAGDGTGAGPGDPPEGRIGSCDSVRCDPVEAQDRNLAFTRSYKEARA